MHLIRLTEAQARSVYSVLVEDGGASSHVWDQDSFALEFSGEQPGSQWRIGGKLGFGGKFHFPSISVDLYRDDETPARRQLVEQINAKLRKLKDQWARDGVPGPVTSGDEPPR